MIMAVLRPYIPLSVRVAVATRMAQQADYALVVDDILSTTEPLRRKLAQLLYLRFGDDAVHLDHDPPLASRKVLKRGGVIVGYRPAANDPDYLVYRVAENHRIKTNVRGEHGQYPDRVLIKKMRRLERPRQRKRKWPSRKMGFTSWKTTDPRSHAS